MKTFEPRRKGRGGSDFKIMREWSRCSRSRCNPNTGRVM